MRTFVIMSCLTFAACGGDAPAPATMERPSAISVACVPPPDCLPIVSLVNIDVCCSDTLRCGFDLSPNICGYDTHLARDTFDELSDSSLHPAFAKPECWTASELNAQLRDNDLAAWAYVPDASGRCDYAALSELYCLGHARLSKRFGPGS